MKEIVLTIKPDGIIHSLYNDFLAEFEGNKFIERASDVIFNEEAQKWIVQILIGKYKGCCLPKTFNRRDDAINAEIEFFNTELFV